MTSRTVRFIGAERINTNLNTIRVRAERPATLRPGAEILKKEMQGRVAKRSYQLHDSIDVRGPFDGRLHIGAGAEGFYGYFLELGTSKMAARPWLVPSVDAARSRVRDAVVISVNRHINAVWGR